MSLLPLYSLFTHFFCRSKSFTPTLNVTLGEYAPYFSQALPHYGKVPEIISKILTKYEIDIKYTWAPWESVYQNVQNKKILGSFVASTSPQQEDRFYFSEPILYNDVVFFHRKRTSIVWENLSDLQGVQSGATLGTRYPRRFLHACETGGIFIDWSSDDVLNFSKLLCREIDVFPVSKEVGLHKLQNHFPPQARAKITWSATPLSSTPVRLMLPKTADNGRHIVELLNRELKRSSHNSFLYFKN